MKFTEAKLEEALIKADSKNRKHGFNYMEKRTRRRNLIEHQNTFTMEALAENVNKFFNFNEYIVLEDLVNKL